MKFKGFLFNLCEEHLRERYGMGLVVISGIQAGHYELKCLSCAGEGNCSKGEWESRVALSKKTHPKDWIDYLGS